MRSSTEFCQWLFMPLPEPKTRADIIRWWEKRRLFYNLFVGGIGFCSLIAFVFFLENTITLKPGEDSFEPIAMFLVPIPINICYTAGWVIECFGLSVGRFRSLKRFLTGPTLLKVGLSFSLFVILLPSVLSGTAWTIKLIFHR